ncbi:exosome complex exonuclease Rrp41 [Candidatus Micrarchaeota archaeon]|nr:exosome complex exonuclease Rrp41 [Candidatus Micrarchaeota archaeon]
MVEKADLFKNGKRIDGRTPMDLRPLKITAGVLDRAQGSCLVEWGRNKVIAAVYGPHEVLPKHLADPTKAIINARYVMAPFSGQEEHGRSGPNRRSIEISKVAKHVFENAVLVEQFPKTMIDVHMEVLQSDGGTRVAGITAGAVALADAGIPLRDMPVGLSAGKIGETLVLDLDKYEDNLGDSDMPFVILPRTGEILLSQMDGMLSREDISQAFDMIFEGAKKVRDKQIEALKTSYERMAAQVTTQGETNQ